MRGCGGPARRGSSGPARLADGDGGRWRLGAGKDLRPPGAEAADRPRVADGCRGPRQDRVYRGCVSIFNSWAQSI